MVLLVLLASESLKIVSASRAYVGGESLWSKAQKEAVYSLFRYAQSHSEADYQSYKEAIAVPMGDRRARLELMIGSSARRSTCNEGNDTHAPSPAGGRASG